MCSNIVSAVLKDKNEIISKLKEHSRDLEESLTDCDIEVGGLTISLEERDKEIDTLREKVEQQNSYIKKLNNEKKLLKKIVKSLQELLDISDDVIDILPF